MSKIIIDLNTVTIEEIDQVIDYLKDKRTQMILDKLISFPSPVSKPEEDYKVADTPSKDITIDDLLFLSLMTEKLELDLDKLNTILDEPPKSGNILGGIPKINMPEKEGKPKYISIISGKIKYDPLEEMTSFAKAHPHYNNENGSLYKIASDLNLNAYEFDILKRIARCRKKGQFKEDLQKIKDTVDLYLKEHKQ